MNRAEFDLALRRGQAREQAFERILTGSPASLYVYVEVKDQSNSRTHVFIEHECYGKPSGLALTTADYWAIEVTRGWWVILPTAAVTVLWRAALDKYGLRHGGDKGAAFGAAVPKEWLVNLPWRAAA